MNPILGEKSVCAVLMFHEVTVDDQFNARVALNPQTEMSTSFFIEIVERLVQRGFTFLSLDQIWEMSNDGYKLKNDDKFACFTFDDGFSNVLTEAYPVMEKFKIPFGIYITTGYPDRTVTHVCRVLEYYALTHTSLGFALNGKKYHFAFSDVGNLHKIIMGISSLFFKEIGHIDRIKIFMEEIGIDCRSYEHLGLSWHQIQTLAQNSLVTIGAHTLTHPDLIRVNYRELWNEVYESKIRLQEKLNVNVDHFSYPFGSYNTDVLNVVKKAGYKTATTIEQGTFGYDKLNLYTIPRLTFCSKRRELCF